MIAIRQRKDRNNNLYLYINFHGKRMSYNTGVSTCYFKEGKVTRKDPLWKEKNNRIDEILSKVTILLLKENNIDSIRRGIGEILGKTSNDNTLIYHLKRLISSKRHPSTKRIYLCTLRKIEALDMNTSDIDIKWLRRFEGKCLETMSVNGCKVHMQVLRHLCNRMVEEGVLQKSPFQRFRIQSEPTVHRSLERDDLIALRDMETTKAKGRYRDIFMLSFYLMGINLRDLVSLRKEDMKGDRITYRRSKTKKIYNIKVEPEALHLINIYRGEKLLLNFMEGKRKYYSFRGDVNWGLGCLRKGLSIYWARHTWATLAFKAGVRKEVISKALGHSFGVRITDTYIEYDQEETDEANRKVLDYIK